MENQKKPKKTIAELQKLVDLLETKSLALDDLELLVGHARELYEFSVVLRYKAFEKHVADDTTLEWQKEHHLEVSKHIPAEAQESENQIAQQPTIEFSLFDMPTDTFQESQTIIPEEKNQIIENQHFNNHIESDEKPQTSTDKKEVELTQETPFFESNVETKTNYQEEASNKKEPTIKNTTQFSQRFATPDSPRQSPITMPRLDTLIGSFGLNERLQYINELFEGSSEAFSEAIKTIDSQTNEEAAFHKASVFADQYNWDLESETVEEFVLKIKRRYA